MNVTNPANVTNVTAKGFYREVARRKRLNRYQAEILLTLFMKDCRLEGWTGRPGREKVLAADHRLLGRCDYDEKRIWITEWAIKNRTPAQLKDTMLHEIAHALAGEKAGHGPAWQEKAAELGMRLHAILRVVMREDPAWQAK